MSIYLDFNALNIPTGLNEQQAEALCCVADSLAGPGTGGAPQMLLRGKNIALIYGSSDPEDASTFEHAATSLGARVARIRSGDAGLRPGAELIATARMLGRLYDAVECQGVDGEVVEQLAQHAGTVVYNAIGASSHQAFKQFDRMRHQALAHVAGTAHDDHGCREAFIQAVLLSTLR
ncbi:MAG: hypothetical protein Q7V20_08020 [Aquabacterium sp.]|uniref:hypothetical protein n=1 Tax=Aquabacterium sp. TaxID=1872578 RepID=UPI002717DE4D|nr:hypothetical protein [Aquabacterium sp.]MDO9003380.1 hypothetical protein [Aquabacterium sp.]